MNFKSAFLLFFVNVNVLFAQLSDYNFRDINVSNGLSNNTVSSIAQDKLGQMWFATSNGLNKFNGRTFTIYRNIPGDVNSISSSEVLNVMVDKDGWVWAGTINGLNKYNPEKESFKRYYRRPSNKNSLSHSLVISSLEMRGGNIWFGTANGVSIYEKKKDRFIRFLQGNSKEGYRAVNAIIRDEKNIIWLATNNGIIKVERDQSHKFSHKAYNLNTTRTDFIVNSLLEISPNMIGVATKYDGYLIFNVKTEQFSRPKGLDVPHDVDVKDLEIDDDNNLWLGTTNGLIIAPSNKTMPIDKGNVAGYASIQNFIKTIYKNKNGFIWIGTQNGGIITWDQSFQNFRHFKNENLKNNITNSIVADSKSNIYFATDDGVINVLDNAGHISELLKIGSTEKNIDYAINSICFFEPNLFFIGTSNKGLLVYDLKDKKIQPDIISTELKDYLNNVTILDIKGDSHNNVYIGTFGKGLIKYNLNSKSLHTYNRPLLATNIIKSIQIVEKDNILVGGIGGLTMLDLGIEGKPKAKIYLKNKLFKTLNVNAVYKDSNNSIWAGTTTNGLYKLEGDVFKRVSFPKKNNFSTVNSILEDDKGILWLSTDSGILKYNTTAKSSILYDQKEILSNNDFRPNSSLKIDGQIYFGDLQGITTFNPKKILKSTNVPKVVLSEFKIKNEIVPITNEDGILSKSINYTDVLELDYNNSNFSISYALPNYISSKGNRYAYRLRGLDDAWTYTKQTEAFFTLQTAGTYSFQVKAANHDDVWSKRTSLKIIVHPAPWKTWWAYTIYILLTFAILYGITWMLQSKSRLKHKLELESIENKRNLELNKAKLQFFTNISHEFRTPLTLILGPLQNILDDYTGSNVMYKKLKVIESSANHLLRLINRLMDFRKLESNQLKLAAAEGNIVKFLQEIYLSFSEHAKIGNYNYEFKTSDNEIYVYYDRYKLERVFYNLISNAFKYTENGGDISINIYKEDQEISIEVKDSGDGIPEKYLDKIFDRFFEIPTVNETDEDYKKGTGIGLSIASNIVKLHHGKIFAKNVKPHGSVFTVKLRLGRGHLSEDDILENFKLSDDVSQYAAQINMQNTELSNNPDDLLIEKKKYTILIVEDNIVLRSFIKEILKPNYNVIQAENGKIALEKAIKHLPDLIVSDVMMPVMVGTELCSKIKTTLATSHIPVILLTSRSSLVYKFEGLESGADDYISKPFNLKEFNLKINNLLEAKQRLKDKFSSDKDLSAIDISLTSLDEQLLEKAFRIVKENIANQDFNIAQFCEELGVSRSMLFTKIKAWTNSTPNDFIQEIRLNHAAKLLEFNKLNISEISYEVGFKRPKYFSQCFQKKYGLTPSEFSKKFANWEQM